MPTFFGSGIAGSLAGLDAGVSTSGSGGVGLGAGLLRQHQLGAFVNPRNGQRPIDANQVRSNDTALQLVHNAHDGNTTIHVQSSTTALRPAPSIGGRKWWTQDDTLVLGWFDSGTAWLPLTVAWENLLNRPSTFAPAAHTHPTSAVVGLDAALASRATLGAAANFSTLTLSAALTLSTRQLVAGSRTYTWPAADGTAAQVLATDGAGGLSWTTQAGAGGGGTPDWSNIINKPSTFPPSAHTQTADTIVGGTLGAGSIVPAAQVGAGALGASTTLPYSQLTGVPTTFAPVTHTQAWSTITSTPATFPSDWGTTANRPSTFAPSAHRTAWSEIDNVPASFTPSAHTHPWGQITDKPTTFAPMDHTHSLSAVVGLDAALAARPVNGGTASFDAVSVASLQSAGLVLATQIRQSNAAAGNNVTHVPFRVDVGSASGSGLGPLYMQQELLTSDTGADRIARVVVGDNSTYRKYGVRASQTYIGINDPAFVGLERVRLDGDVRIDGTLTASGTATASNFILSSDRRLKSDIVRLSGALDMLAQMGGYRYVKGGQVETGVLAQEVQAVLPDAVVTMADGYLAVAYDRLIPVLIEAVNELSRKVDACQKI